MIDESNLLSSVNDYRNRFRRIKDKLWCHAAFYIGLWVRKFSHTFIVIFPNFQKFLATIDLRIAVQLVTFYSHFKGTVFAFSSFNVSANSKWSVRPIVHFAVLNDPDDSVNHSGKGKASSNWNCRLMWFLGCNYYISGEFRKFPEYIRQY